MAIKTNAQAESAPTYSHSLSLGRMLSGSTVGNLFTSASVGRRSLDGIPVFTAMDRSSGGGGGGGGSSMPQTVPERVSPGGKGAKFFGRRQWPPAQGSEYDRIFHMDE